MFWDKCSNDNDTIFKEESIEKSRILGSTQIMMPIYSPGCQKSTGSKNPNVSLSSYVRSTILTHFDVRNSSKN